MAGEATGAPGGTGVEVHWRNLTTGGPWTVEQYTPTPDANGIWLLSIPNANPLHRYEVYATYDVKESLSCTYAGTGSITWC